MLVVGAVLLALGVDLAALFGGLQGLQIGQYRLPTAPPPMCSPTSCAAPSRSASINAVLDRVLRQEWRIRRESIKRFGNAGLCPTVPFNVKD